MHSCQAPLGFANRSLASLEHMFTSAALFVVIQLSIRQLQDINGNHTTTGVWRVIKNALHVSITDNNFVAHICPPTDTTTLEKGKGSPSSIAERRVLELIPVLCSQPARDVSHKPSGRLPLLSARLAVTLATLKTAATNFAAW